MPGEGDGTPLTAVDIGNSRTKVGWYDRPTAVPLPSPSFTFDLDTRPWISAPLTAWLGQAASHRPAGWTDALWVMASVNRAASSVVRQWLLQRDPGAQIREIRSGDVAID